jgi:hypothetical protein
MNCASKNFLELGPTECHIQVNGYMLDDRDLIPSIGRNFLFMTSSNPAMGSLQPV